MSGLELWKKELVEKVETMGVDEAYRVMNFLGEHALVNCCKWCVGCQEDRTCREGILEFLKKEGDFS